MSNPATQFKRKFNRDDNFFMMPNSVNSYWAGVIAADGCVTDNKYQTSVSLSSTDIDLIEKFKASIQYDGKTSTHIEKIGKLRYTVNITFDTAVLRQLESIFSITTCKSKTLMPPKLSDECHILSFIRGYMDGDGSIYGYFGRKTSKRQTWAVSFNGTYAMLAWIKFYIQKYVDGVGDPKLVQHASIYKLTFSGKQSILILNWLYSLADQSVRLDHKYDKYLEARNG